MPHLQQPPLLLQQRTQRLQQPTQWLNSLPRRGCNSSRSDCNSPRSGCNSLCRGSFSLHVACRNKHIYYNITHSYCSNNNSGHDITHDGCNQPHAPLRVCTPSLDKTAQPLQWKQCLICYKVFFVATIIEIEMANKRTCVMRVAGLTLDFYQFYLAYSLDHCTNTHTNIK